MSALSAGAECPHLFELRNEAKRTATQEQQQQMNSKLRSVGCFSITSKRVVEVPPNTGGFTVWEYRIYSAVISAPMSVPEAQAMRNVAESHRIPVAEVRKTTEKVQAILSKNNWFGSPESEIRHASDWKGEKP